MDPILSPEIDQVSARMNMVCYQTSKHPILTIKTVSKSSRAFAFLPYTNTWLCFTLQHSCGVIGISAADY